MTAFRKRPGPRLPKSGTLTLRNRAPATLEEAEAIAWARESVRRLQGGTFATAPLPWGGPVEDSPFSWFGRTDNRRWAKHLLKGLAMDALFTSHICNLARERWDFAHEALCELAAEREQRGQDLPMAVRQYRSEVVQAAAHRHPRRRKGGWEKADNFLRDLAVVSIVVEVCERFCLLPTRSRTSLQDRPSGCHVVASALHAENVAISEEDVVKIWTRYGRSAMPEGGWSHLRRA